MNKTKQCKNEFVFSSELNILYLCVRNKGHKGKHKFIWNKFAKNGRVLKERTFYADG